MCSKLAVNDSPLHKSWEILLLRESEPQWAFTCSKLATETLEQGVKYV